MRSNFYRDNLREVADAGVQAAMDTFFAEHGDETAGPAPQAKPLRQPGTKSEETLVCEDILLEAFSA